LFPDNCFRVRERHAISADTKHRDDSRRVTPHLGSKCFAAFDEILPVEF
jgi:hypothetical protein